MTILWPYTTFVEYPLRSDLWFRKKYLVTGVTDQLTDPFSPSYLPLDVTPLHTIKSALHCVYISCTSLCWLIDFLSALCALLGTHTHAEHFACLLQQNNRSGVKWKLCLTPSWQAKCLITSTAESGGLVTEAPVKEQTLTKLQNTAQKEQTNHSSWHQ